MKNSKTFSFYIIKFIATVLLFFIYVGSFAQADTIALRNAVVALDKALLANDSIVLMKLLHPQVTYGHSNGWVETRGDVIKDLRTGYLVYENIESSNIRTTRGDDWASVRLNAYVKGSVSQKAFEMQLYILQVWKKMKSGWQLIGRQSGKL
jgi:hypothetical protein